MTLQFEASLTDDARSVNYDRNTFIIQATGSAEANRRETKSYLGRVFNFKLDHFCYECNHMVCTIDLKEYT